MILRPNKTTRREVLEENARIAEAAKKTALLACAAIQKLGGSVRFNATDFAEAGELLIDGKVDGEEMVFSVKPKSMISVPGGGPLVKANGTPVIAPEVAVADASAED